MKKNKRNIGIALLCVFIGLSAVPFFSPIAPPSPQDDEVRLIKFEETDGNGVAGLLRTASESQEENSRPNDFIFHSFIADFHSVCDRLRITQSRYQENSKRPTKEIYLHNSCLTI
jgi:hypothetical protein